MIALLISSGSIYACFSKFVSDLRSLNFTVFLYVLDSSILVSRHTIEDVVRKTINTMVNKICLEYEGEMKE